MRARLSAKSGAISTKLTPQSDTEALIRMGPSPLAETLITNESRRMPRPFKGSGGSRAHEC